MVDAPAALLRAALGADGERPPVEGLDERHARLAHERPEQAGREVGAEKPSVSASRKQTSSPSSTDSARHIASPLPSTGPYCGHQLGLLRRPSHPHARPTRRGAVGGARVDDDDLVDRARARAARAGRSTIAPDRAGALPRGQADRHALLALGGDPRRRVERMMEGAGSVGPAGGWRHIASTISTPWPSIGQSSRGAPCSTRARGRAPRARGLRGARPGDARASLPPSCTRSCSAALRAHGHRAASTPIRPRRCSAAWRGPDDRHDGHRLGQVAVLQPADTGRALPRRARARALPLPDQGARPGPGPRAGRLRPAQAGAPRDLRRRHPARGARGDPAERRTSC